MNETQVDKLRQAVNESGLLTEVKKVFGATVGIDRNVKIFVHQKIVSVPLADDTKVVDERFLHTYLGVKLVLSHASALILVASCLP